LEPLVRRGIAQRWLKVRKPSVIVLGPWVSTKPNKASACLQNAGWVRAGWAVPARGTGND